MKSAVKTILFLLFSISTVLYCAESIAANYPLEIMNIKPLNTGSPPITASNRVFRAYPGIEYNVRAAVIGGLYPYHFSIANAPNGMTIDPTKGVISWANPQANSGVISLTVTDAENNASTSSWSIVVSANGFLFVDGSYSGVELGTIDQPYNSIDDILALDGHAADIVYFRGGTYTLPIFNNSYSGDTKGCNLTYGGGRPHQWIAFPGETVAIDMQDHYLETYSQPDPYYFDNIHFFNMDNHGFRGDSANSYYTIRRCEFSDLTCSRTTNSNQGFIFVTHGNGTGSFLVLQDNKWHDYTNTVGIGSIYFSHKILIENNSLYNQFLAGGVMSTSIAIKESVSRSTVRGNTIIVSQGHSILGAEVNGMYYNSSDNEVCFNYFRYENGAVSRLNPASNTGRMFFYRNTVVGNVVMKQLDGSACDGPFTFADNVFMNSYCSSNGVDLSHYSNVNSPQNCVSITNNICGNSQSGIVDGEGNLTSSYLQYVGRNGWQVYSISNPKNLLLME